MRNYTKILRIYGIITTVSLALQAFGLAQLRWSANCDIDGFVKFPCEQAFLLQGKTIFYKKIKPTQQRV